MKKTNTITAIFALLIVSLVVLGCNFSTEKPNLPSEAETQSLLKTTMSDFASAVEKEDFKAFKESASKDFQSQFSEDKLKTTFKVFTDKKAVIVPVLREAAGKNPTFSPAPALREEKGYHILVAKGDFDTDEAKVKFDNEYVYQDGKWKLLKILVNVE